MSDEFFIDGKPLGSLRVVDLREELKKRGIRSSGTKIQLQQLLITALSSSASVPVPDVDLIQPNENKVPEPSAQAEPVNQNQILNTSHYEVYSNNNSSIDDDNSNYNDSIKSDKIASITINEEKETIKLTIRSSPRKSEPQSHSPESDTESSQSSGVNDSPENIEQQTIKLASSPPSVSTIDHNQQSQSEQLDHKKTSSIEEKDISKNDDQFSSKSATKLSEAFEQEKPMEKILLQQEQILEKAPDVKKVDKKQEKKETMSTGNKVKTDGDDSKKQIELKDNQTVREKLTTQKSQESRPAVQRKRRWGGSHGNDSSVLKKGISSDELKQLINDSVLVDNDQANKVSKTNEDTPISTAASTTNIDQIKNDEQQQKPSNEMATVIKEVKKIDIQFKNNEKTPQKENGIIEDDSNNKVRSVSPAKNPESTVIFVTGLVRPYTMPQLKKLLNNTGKIDEEKFWIDKIKSKCYVTYSTVEEAVETRKALHNLKWPQSSPKNLCVEFATLEDIDRCLHPENYEDLPMKTAADSRKILDKDVSKGKYDIIMKESKTDFTKSNKNETTSGEPPTRALREWDRDKLPLKRHDDNENVPSRSKRIRPASPLPTSLSSSSQQQHHEKQPTQTKTEQRTTKTDKKKDESNQRSNKAKSESPVNQLEDLFRKTKTIPYIYWLPLTEEQSLEREKQRAKLEKDRENRLAQQKEMISRRSPPRKMPPRNRSPRRRSPDSPTPRRKTSYNSPPRRTTQRHSRSRSPVDRRRYSSRRR